MRGSLLSTRRTIAASLALLFLLQSSGSAFAATSQLSFSFATPGLSMQIARAFDSFYATRVGALLIGSEARWTAMHAPPPTHPAQASPHPNPELHHTFARPVLHAGSLVSTPAMKTLLRGLPAIALDPRATQHTQSMRQRRASAGISAVLPRHRMTSGVISPFSLEADTTSGPTNLFVTGGAESGAVSQIMDEAPGHTAANETLSYTPYTGAMSFGWVSPSNIPASTSWPAQTYTVTLNVTQPNANLKITEVKLYRVDSNGGPGSGGLAGVADEAGLSQSLGTSGTLTFTLSGTAQTANVTDRIGVKFIVSNMAASGTQTISYLAGQGSGSGLNISGQASAAPTVTGITPWWTYQPGKIGGVGTWDVNVASGNLLLQTSDLDVRERGIDLAFRRTYNSQSQHTYANADGSVMSNYGDGWTNTFDAHLSYSAPTNSITVYDVDGAVYTYTANNGQWSPPAGQHSTLQFDGSCGYYWTKKTGTTYYFYSPTYDTTCQAGTAGYDGRLHIIYGRNHNNYIQFNYSWTNGDASSGAQLSKIVAQHSDGDSLTLTFADFNGKRLLSSITRPDGSLISYLYSNPSSNNPNGDLEEVDLPGNSEGTLKQQYGYYSATNELNWVASPNWFMSNGAQGSYTWFNYTGNSVSSVQLYGWDNFTPGDGTGVALQGTAQTSHQMRLTSFAYSSGQTQVSDTDGHATIWSFDASDRVTQTQEYTGEASPLPTYLVKTLIWDPNNNVTETTDARANATDYAFDSTGNIVAVALPSVSTDRGTFRPTKLYSYDAFNNVTAYCDPVKTHALGKDWTSNPGGSDSLCPSQAGASYFSLNLSDSAEPYGYLTDAYTVTGYHLSFSYNTTAEGGDFGLPTSVSGPTISQYDGSQTQLAVNLTYDAKGNELTRQNAYGTLTSQYDSLNRNIRSEDAVGVSTYSCYYADGSVEYTESASQHSSDGGTQNVSACSTIAPQWAHSYSYDANGNTMTEVAHFNNERSETDRVFDGADRLVEVEQPWDSTDYGKQRDYYPFRWMERYIYDISQGGTQQFYGQNYGAHGALAKRQQYIAGANMYWDGSATPHTPSLSGSWQDQEAYAYDALDRQAKSYSYDGTSVYSRSTTYDETSSTLGEVYETCDELNQCIVFNYDTDANNSSKTYQGAINATPNLTYSYDPDGRVTSITSTQYGTQSYAYNADGTIQKTVEAASGGVSSYATLTLHYYLNGQRSSMDVASSPTGTGLNQTGLLRYAYRSDGTLSSLSFADGASASTALTFGYDAAGKLLSRNENTSGSAAYSSSYTYDSFGRLQTESFPSGSLSNMTYGYEDERQAVTGPNGTAAYNFNVRGEDLSNTVGFGTSANGLMVDESPAYYSGFNALFPRMTLNGPEGTNGSRNGYTYDGAGERTRTDTSGYLIYGQTKYDVDQHIVSNLSPVKTSDKNGTYYKNTTMTYGWGPNGHPIQIGGVLSDTLPGTTPQPSQPETLHWDGPTLLFTTNSAGAVDDINIGGYADYTPLDFYYKGLTFWDRDVDNSMVAFHNSTGASHLLTPNAWLSSTSLTWGTSVQVPQFAALTKPSSIGQGLNVGHGLLISDTRRDGYFDGYSTIQGVRNYDSGTAEWTSADELRKLGDPLASSPYTWNRNDPTDYMDPAGYCADNKKPDPKDPSCTIAQPTSHCQMCWLSPLDKVRVPHGELLNESVFLGHRTGPLGISEKFNSQEALYFTQEGARHGVELGVGELGIDELLELAGMNTTGTQGISVLEPVVDAGAGFFSYMTLGAVQQVLEHQLYNVFNSPEGNPYHLTPIH